MKKRYERAGGLRRLLALMLCMALTVPLFAGCGKDVQEAPGRETAAALEATQAAVETTVPEETVPPTVPADGDPDNVTCKGTYTAEDSAVKAAADTVAATAGEQELTNGLLQVFYWMEAEAYRQAGHEIAPDFDKPLDTQECPIDDTAASWQQYFLQRALNAWHSAQALVLQADAEGVPTEEAYQPNLKNHDIYLTEKPATKVLYGFNKGFQPNELHQAYLDGIPAMLEEVAADNGFAGLDALAADAAGAGADGGDLSRYAELYNLAYMYFTTLNYSTAAEKEEVEAFFTEKEGEYQAAGINQDSGSLVDIRHALLIPEGAVVASDGAVNASEEAWNACETEANAMLEAFLGGKDTSEPRFAELANENSADAGSSLNGGLYQNLHRGQLDEPLDSWCFDDARQSGDTVVLRSDCGVHILYFSGSKEIWYAAAERDLLMEKGGALIAAAREKYPMTVDYSAIVLGTAENTASVSADTLLYPDVAHERFPVVPLYLQQDYPTTYYGAYKITSHGCGITTMAMLASYLADDELTPPELCDRYGNYCLKNGTNAIMFEVTPAEMGFYLKEKTFDWRVANEAMEEGYIVISLQHKGFFTRGGHYLVLEELLENGELQIRDSNIYNYGKLHGHKSDSFDWANVIPAGACYWIYQHKITRIPACARCGEPQGEGIPRTMFTGEYRCEICDAALLRRGSYMAGCASANP